LLANPIRGYLQEAIAIWSVKTGYAVNGACRLNNQ